MDKLSVFFGDDPLVLAEVQAACNTVTHPRGRRIFGEGDESDRIFIVLAGAARAVRFSLAGSEVAVSTFGPGALFGEMAALRGGGRTADVYALEDVTLASMSGAAFIAILEKHGVLAVELCRLLAARIEATTHRLFEEVTLSSKDKIYAWLLREIGPGDDDAIPCISTMPSISDLARELNLARETVSRTISRLREDNILQDHGAGLRVPEPHRLVRLLEG